MKTLIQIFFVALFGIEMCSPFFISYLNQKEKLKKTYLARESKQVITKAEVKPIKAIKNWQQVDFSENNYSDSKTFTVKE